MSQETPAIPAALLAGAFLLIGVLVTHRLSLWRDKRTSRLAAHKQFRAAIIDATSRVPPKDKHWGRELIPTLRTVAEDVSRAAKTLAPYLGPKGRGVEGDAIAFATLCTTTLPNALDTAQLLYGTGPDKLLQAKSAYFSTVEALLRYACEA